MEHERVTVATLHVENVKAVKAVHMELGPTGLTVIGGKNGQGKTSVLDAIAWTLGGAKFAPSSPGRDGSMNPPLTQITLSNGLTVERRGKNSTLKVVDPSGKIAGQKLLDSFISQFALDLPKFLNADTKRKADTLLEVLGIGPQLQALEDEEQKLYAARHAIGQLWDARKKYAGELPEHPDAPAEPVSALELIQRQQAILAQNGENQRKRDQLQTLRQNLSGCQDRIGTLAAELESLKRQEELIQTDIETARKTAEDLRDESTAEIEASLLDIETTNAAVRANQQKGIALDEAIVLEAQYTEKTAQLEAARKARLALLDGANLPLDGLTVETGELLYGGKRWDCMSGSEQLRVAVAIVQALNPGCGFVLMDKLEQFDLDTMRAFAKWLESEGLQVIATRVSTGNECSIIIENGLPQGQTYAEAAMPLDDDGDTEWR